MVDAFKFVDAIRMPERVCLVLTGPDGREQPSEYVLLPHWPRIHTIPCLVLDATLDTIDW
jgi:hypothetical protein